MRVLQLIDSLNSGGSERVAVNMANSLVNGLEKSFLCATRKEGLLKSSIDPNVTYLFLNKQSALDLRAIRNLNIFIKSHSIDIIHAHSSSFFLATVIKLINKKVKVVWHDHYGNSEFLHQRKSRAIKICSKFFDFIFCVNRNLENWAKQYLKNAHALYLPNFAIIENISPQTILKGNEGKRIVCLANLRKQKDHFALIRAFKNVIKNNHDWSLHLVGKDFHDDYSRELKKELKDNKLQESVFLYGSRPDIQNILRQCDVGILSSKSEGLPLAILEYGLSGLPVIATRVGECASIINNKIYGILVNPNSISELSNALDYLIDNKDERSKMARALNKKVSEEHSKDVIVNTVINTYKKIK